MTSIKRFVGGLSFLTGAVIACGGGTSGGGGGGSSADEFITQYCDTFSPCCAKTGKTYDQSKCRLVFALLSGDSTYDPGAGQQCLDAARAESSSPTFCDAGLSADGSAKCKGVFPKGATAGGTKQPGAPCEEDSECASSPDGEGNCATSFSKDSSTKTCQIQARGKLGDDCVGEKETTDGTTIISTSGSSSGGPPPNRVNLCFIDDALFCESTFTSGSSTQTRKCAKIQDIGGPCTSSVTHACVKTAFCDTKAKLCAARKALGETCDTFGSQCVEKSYCNSTTKVCTTSIASGSPCTKNEECEKGSCTNGKCGSSISISSASFVCQ